MRRLRKGTPQSRNSRPGWRAVRIQSSLRCVRSTACFRTRSLFSRSGCTQAAMSRLIIKLLRHFLLYLRWPRQSRPPTMPQQAGRPLAMVSAPRASSAHAPKRLRISGSRARAKGTCHLALPHHLAHLGLSAWHVSLEHRWLAARTKGTAAVGSPTAGDRWR